MPWDFLPNVRDEGVAQGDIFDGVRFFVPLEEGVYEEGGRVIVVSHSCDCEKSLNDRDRPLLIAPLYPLDELPDGQSGHARAGRMARYWPLGGPNPRAAEFGVDLLQIQPVLVDYLLEADRLMSMDDEGQETLGARIAEVITYRKFVAPREEQ